MRTNKTVKKYVTVKGLCTGCGICTSLFDKECITIEMKNTGFYRPLFSRELSEKELKLFTYVCPALNMQYNRSLSEDESLMGKTVECKVGWSASPEIRFKASSGGGVTAFLLFLLENHIVDGVFHVGRGSDPLSAKGILSTDSNQIKNNMGSLYRPVSLLRDFRDILDKVEKIAIVGKGCDIRAIRRFVEVNPMYKSKIILCVGILCGGTPSIKGTNRILDDFRMKPNEISMFRYRGYGWPGQCTAKTSKSVERKMSYNEAWAKRLGPTSSLACKICFDGIADSADIVFGDAWKCENGNYPSFEETDGRNLIICRTEFGRKLLDKSVSTGYIIVADEFVDDGLFKIIQPSQSNRRYLAKFKIMGLRVLGFLYPRIDLKYLNKLYEASGVKMSIGKMIRTIGGSMKRAIRAKEE